jgi:hypothetical protein
MIECETKPIDVFSLGNSISIGTLIPEFAQDTRFISGAHACTNVIVDLPGGAPVIPWQMIETNFIAGQLRDESTWAGKEGICTTAGIYRNHLTLKLPSALNVFAAWAQKNGLEIEISPAGQIAR